MREIKFRAWSYTNKKMYYRVLVGNTLTDDPCSTVYNNEGWKNFDKACGVIMQYSGLKDKNGKEIYEGDIVKTDWQHDGFNNYDYELIGIAQFVEEYKQFMIVQDKGNQINYFPFYSFNCEELDEESIEIIGNIYENPELLKENSNDSHN